MINLNAGMSSALMDAISFAIISITSGVSHRYTEGTVNPHTGVIAVAMPTPPSQPPMALGISGKIETLRQERDRYLELLIAALQPYRARSSPPKT